jgi:hypothetical protein
MAPISSVQTAGRGRLVRRAAIRAAVRAAAAWTLAAAGARPAAAQRILGLGGLEARGGAAHVVDATTRWNAAAELDLGYLWRPSIRTTLGYDYFNGGNRRAVAGERFGGTLRGHGVQASLRADLLGRSRLSPYALLGLTVHHLSVSGVGDPTVAGLIEGTYVGPALGGGAAYRLGRAFVWSVTGDVRRVWAGNASRTLVAAGLRYAPRGRGAYDDARRD